MDLLIPRRVGEQEFADRINAEVDQQIEGARLLETELKAIDYSLSIVLVKDNADPDEFEYPGYWYIRKRVPGSVDAYFPLVGDAGERLEPGPWVLDRLKAEDLWNPRVHRSKQEAREKLRAAKVRAKALRAEQRQDVMKETIRAAKRVRDDRGMTKSSAAKRRGEGIELPPGVVL